MARLPTPGSDSNVWGTVLNDFLLQAHNPNGTLKTGAVTSTVIAPDAISTAVIKDGSIPASKLQVTAGTNGQVLTYDAAAAGGLSWSNASGGGTATLGGDLTGSLSNAQIVANAITTTEIADAAVTNAKLASGIDQSKITGLATDLAAKVNASALGAADGVATLDSSGKVPASQLPPAGTPGEANTASNVGTSGVGLYLQKTGTNLEFKKLRPGSSKVTLADDIATNTVSVDVDTANLGLTKSTVGLSNVDNTSDLNKPVSTATQSALDAKANSSSLATVATTGSYTDLINKPMIPNIVASATAPANPSIGDMWVDTSG